MFYPCQTFKSIVDSGPRRLPEGWEQRHLLLDVRVEDGQCIAKFPNGEFAFPEELREKLAPLVGRKVGVLRLDGYHIREVSP